MNSDSVQIRLSDIFHTLLKQRGLIAALTAIGLTAGIVLSVVSYMRGEMSKRYAITTSIAVTSQTRDGYFTSKSSDPNQTDIYLAENMVDSVIYLMKSDKTLDAAVEKLNLVGISPRDIYNNLTMKQYNETQIIEVTLYWRSAEEGVQILNAINTVSPQILIDVLKIGGVSVVNKPTARYLIGGSMNVSMWVYMAAVGFFAGAGLSILQLLFHPKLLNVRDIPALLGLETLGEIPYHKRLGTKKGSMMEPDDSAVGESVRQSYAMTAHILNHRLKLEKNHCIYITSAGPNEGKSTAAANLAMQLAELEKKVLLIDFDVRNPNLGSMFLKNVDYGHSINAVYHGDVEPGEAVVRLSGFLDLLPAILDRHEIPLDEAMMEIVRRLEKDYDYVLMDTSPVGRVADPMSLNRIAQTAVFVIRYDYSDLREIRESLEILDKSGIRIMGCIANCVRRVGSDSYHQYYKSYSGNRRQYGSPEARLNNVPQGEVTAGRIAVAADEAMEAAAAEIYAADHPEEDQNQT